MIARQIHPNHKHDYLQSRLQRKTQNAESQTTETGTPDPSPQLHIDIFSLVQKHQEMTQPMRTVTFNDQPYNCLCDSGACTTVVRHSFPSMKMSNKTVWVKSASGHVTPLRYTHPANIMDKDTKKCVKLPVLIDSSCPINLLGRDSLQALDIGVVPGPDGKMKVINLESSCFVEGTGVPHFYWSLDLTDTPTQKQLLTMAKEKLSEVTGPGQRLDFMAEGDLHCTLRYKREPGPDEPYDQRVHKLKGTTTCLQSMLVSPSGQS